MTTRVNKPNLNFKDMVNQPVYTSENVYLGKINSINKNHIEVKFYENDNHGYNFPLDLLDKWDGHSIWLQITHDESNQYSYNSTIDIGSDTHTKTDYETVTFRLNENVMRAIRTEANNRDLSLNNFANYILKRYTDEDKFENDVGTAYINKPVVIEIFNKKSRDEVIKLAKHSAKNAIYNKVLFSDGYVNLETFVNWISGEMNKYSFSFKHMISKNKNTYIIWHGVGYNFSLYYKIILEEIFNDHLNRPVNFTITNEILVFETNSE